ncbi:DNA topoisomerase I, mitochondrial-like isoform X2 [Artemia franciscana]|uniref:DNA topoisomerase I, mitochondrial-like isoform X2 n=1 Tax=Artemia franciscana TaxID=6661 RepID=UPI0032DBF2EA
MGTMENETIEIRKEHEEKKDGDSRSEHKSSSKHKHKDKERDRDRDRERKDKDRKDRDRERDKDRGDKEKSHSSSKDKDRSDRDKDRDKHRDKSRSDEKMTNGHSSSKDKEKDRERKDRDKDREKDREREREKGKDKEREKDRDKERERDRDKEREKDRDKERSKDKDKEREREKDRHKDRDRKDKDRHSSSHKDKHRDKDRDKDRERKDKEKEGDKERREKPKDKIKDEPKVEETAEIAEFPKHEETHNVRITEDEDTSVFKTETEEIVDVKQEVPEAEVDVTATVETVKMEETIESDPEDVPLSKRKSITNGTDYDSDVPLSARKKIKSEVTTTTTVKKQKKRKIEDDEDEEYEEKKKKKKATKKVKTEETTTVTKKKVKKEEENVETWKWWEEKKEDDGVKWRTLEHKGPVFAPPYEPLPKNVKFYYNGKHIELTQDTEEVATFYGRMLDHDYTAKEQFNTNFFKDWRKTMTSAERELITDLKKCDFSEINAYFKRRSEENKNRTKEEKQKTKAENEKVIQEFGFCTIDGHKQRIGNFKIEPPGLFRGRGDHPKMGMVKRRVMPEDVIINCSKGTAPSAPAGHKWKEVRSDNTVTWLASWTENVQGQVKYVMLNAASHLKGERDWNKYEMARKLKKMVGKIREQYQMDYKAKEMRVRQRAVALYFIDKLALRAGNEKDEDQADTVGCCSLRVEHISLDETKNGKDFVVTFDFLGKDSIRYYNEISVEKRVFKNLQIFMDNKQPGDDLFDRLNTTILNKHLNEIMEGLTAKVFRTYNASFTLQDQLDKLTNPDDSLAEKILAYNRANRAVAILCNHQRAVPKTFAKSMENLQAKIDAKKETLAEAEKNLKDAKKEVKRSASQASKAAVEKCQKPVVHLREYVSKLKATASIFPYEFVRLNPGKGEGITFFEHTPEIVSHL